MSTKQSILPEALDLQTLNMSPIKKNLELQFIEGIKVVHHRNHTATVPPTMAQSVVQAAGLCDHSDPQEVNQYNYSQHLEQGESTRVLAHGSGQRYVSLDSKPVSQV